MRRISPLAALALALSACGAPRPDAPPPAADGGASRGPPSSPASLRPLSTRPREGGFAALGLTGGNKPNGMDQRLRRSVPAGTPDFVPPTLGGLDLWIADPADGGWLAFYRGPLELRPGAANADFRAAFFGPGGDRLWDLALNPLLSRPDHLEIQDIRLHDGRLYFNEGCQSYSREAGGACSALVRVDPRSGRVDWRTRPRVSNDVFIFHDPHVVAGYGFTAEPDSLFLVEQSSGRIAARHPLDTAHAYLEVVDGRLVVVTRERVYAFELP